MTLGWFWSAVLVALAPVAQAAPADAPAGPALTRAPELIAHVPAVFPPSETGKTGSVVLAITIGVDGTVEAVTVSESAGPAFDAAAVEAARQFRFVPAELDGVPARIRILYRTDFFEVVEQAVPTIARFDGVVRDRLTRTPLAGVTVRLADGRAVATDDQGRFAFDEVPPGALGVVLEGERLTPLQTEETFVAGEQLTATYDVLLQDPGDEGDDLEVLVVAPTLKREAVSTEIAAEEARRVPGTQGDVLRVVESLPGVARASLGTGALVVWGSAPEDTGVYVDGVPVPRLYHDGGLRSVVGSEFVSSVALVPGGYGAAYGRGLGGLVTVRTQDFSDRWRAGASADLYDGAVGFGGPVGKAWQVGGAGRVGWVAPLLTAVAPDVEDVFPVPHYRDAQLRVGRSFGSGTTLRITGLASWDQTQRTAPNPDPSREAAEDRRLDFQRIWVDWTRDAGDGSVARVLVFAGADQSDQIATFGPVATSVVTDTALAGARISYRARWGRLASVEGGLDGSAPVSQIVRTGSVALPAREGDIRVFGQPPPDQIAADAFAVTQLSLAPYAEADVAPWGERLHVVPGLRFDPAFRSVSQAAPQIGASPTRGLYAWNPHLEPRLAVRAQLHPLATVTVAGGRYAQAPSPADLSSSFGNPALPIATGTHLLVGGAFQPTPPLSVEVTGFHTASEGLAMRSTLSQPAAAEALLPTGRSRTTGVQSLVRLDPTGGAYGWVSYTLAWALRQSAPGLAWRPSDYDQRHVLTALAGIKLPLGFDTGARVRVSSGFPRTEVVGAYYDSRRDLYQPLFGAHNAVRLPTFFQLDLRVAKAWSVGGGTLDVSLDVQNATAQTNVEEWVYSTDYGTRGAIQGLPLLPVLGVRWSR